MLFRRKTSNQFMQIRKPGAYDRRRRVVLLTIFLAVAIIASPLWPFAFGADSSPHSDVLSLLTKTVAWYHQLDIERQIATDPTEIVIVADNSQIASEVVRLAFDYARAEAANTQTNAGGHPDQNPSASQRVQSLIQLSNKLDSEVTEFQSSVDSLKKKAETASGRKLTELRSAIAETQSELDLALARRDAVHSMADFVNQAGPSGLGLGGARAEIESLASTLPPELTTVTGVGKTTETAPARAASTTTPAIKAAPSGFWGLISDLFSISRKSRTLDQLVNSTDALTESTKQLASGPLSKLRGLAQEADTLAKPTTATDPAALAQEKQNIDAMTAQFKQISAVVLPLNKLTIMLELYRVNLNNWQAILKTQLRSDLETLLVRATILGLIIAVILAVGGVLRRTIIRYVQEPRRRYQFLLLNKIALWTLIAIIVAFSFASQIGSVATFAGLLTAGLAVALQNVLVSVVGYFFLIGKFGSRVGDRVQISGVNGEVVDVGLVRLQVMEFGGPGSNVPTGRVVAFSNSVVFQTNGLFRQIPGTSFVWHQITLTLAADSDYAVVEKRLLGAVEKVFAEYRDKMERQRLQMERSLEFSLPNELKPLSRLQLTPAGIEAVIRFPVDYTDAADVDDRVIRELLKAIEQEPKLKVVAPSTPTLSISEVAAPKTSS
jgi:small-conductance mechanosensitive channel